jgi:hypothetical protein
VLSVQLAADSASAAAPRTVLQAESAMHVPTSNAVINFDFMSTLPYMSETTWRHLLLLSTVCPMNGITLSMKKCPARQFAGEAFYLLLQQGLSLAFAGTVDGVLGAVRHRVHVCCRTAHRIAGGKHQRSGNQSRGHDLLDHLITPPLMAGERGFVQSAPFRVRNFDGC